MEVDLRSAFGPFAKSDASKYIGIGLEHIVDEALRAMLVDYLADTTENTNARAPFDRTDMAEEGLELVAKRLLNPGPFRGLHGPPCIRNGTENLGLQNIISREGAPPIVQHSEHAMRAIQRSRNDHREMAGGPDKSGK